MNPPNLLRSLLFVPGDDTNKLTKAASSGADALILDLEDSVAPPRKEIARRCITEFLNATRDQRTPKFIRFHSCSSLYFEADCKMLEGAVPAGIVLSKCASSRNVEQLDMALNGSDQGPECRILPLIETARGIVNAQAIATASPRVRALLFGAEDFCTDTGIQTSAEEPELLFARSSLVIACAAAGLPAIDTPFLHYGDATGLREAARRARRLGFAGKLAIHPAQIECLNESFRPTEQELGAAAKIIDLVGLGQTGVASLEGQMMDEAHLKRARQTLAAGELDTGKGSGGWQFS